MMFTDTKDQKKWQAVKSNDASYDGEFYYGVHTTGIFCRPSCPSKLPQAENVSFYYDVASAKADGLRACKRCLPESQSLTLHGSANAQLMHAMCRYIQSQHAQPLTLSVLAEQAGMSQAHFQKTFKKHIGLSPKKYHEACRFNVFKRKLKEGESITNASLDSGFQSASRVHEKTSSQLGMQPKQYKSGGLGLTIYYACAQTKIGRVMIGATERGICFLQFASTDTQLLTLLHSDFNQAELKPMHRKQTPSFDIWIQALNEYLLGQINNLHLPLDIQGTAFQKMVWEYLQNIPCGTVESYQSLAQGINKPSATRAVASACARNKIAIAIPCHRVIRGNGELAGYKWGIKRKQKLIGLEQKDR